MHTRPITCLDICGRTFVSASRDCTIRLWKLKKNEGKVEQVALRAKHRGPIVFVRTSYRFKQVISVSRDGFLMCISALDGRYIRGLSLPVSNPTGLVVSDAGFVAVCFNGPDSHTIIVLDQNMLLVAQQTFDGCVKCWATMEFCGIEYLVVALKKGKLTLVQLPCMTQTVFDITLPFVPSFIAVMKNEAVCYLASHDGGIFAFPIRTKPT
jgi:hypothetical protein